MLYNYTLCVAIYYNILSCTSIEVVVQLIYYCRVYEGSWYKMLNERATFIALSFIKPLGLHNSSTYGRVGKIYLKKKY